MRIIINSHTLELQENDEVTINSYECEDCGSHEEISVEREGKTIANFGDAVAIHSRHNNGEIFGGVLVNSKGKIQREYLIHLFPKERRKMTSDRMHYIPLCDIVLIHEGDTKYDQICWEPTDKELNNTRICKECLKAYKDLKK